MNYREKAHYSAQNNSNMNSYSDSLNNQERSYFPQYEIFINNSNSKQQQDKQDNAFPPRKVFNDVNQFKISNNTSFKFFSDKKAQNEISQAEIEKQKRFCYSEQLPTNNIYDQNKVKYSFIKHQEKVQQQLNSCSNSIMKNISANSSYNKINQSDKNNSLNSSMSSQSSSRLNFGKGITQRNPNKGGGYNNNILEEDSSDSQQSFEQRTSQSQRSSNDMSFSVYKSEISFQNEINRRRKNVAKNILIFVFLTISVIFFSFFCKELYQQYNEQTNKTLQDIRETQQIQYKNKFYSELTEDSQKGIGLNTELSRDQKIMKLANEYYDKILELIQQDEKQRIYQSKIFYLLINEQKNDWSEIFQLVEQIRKQNGRIQELPSRHDKEVIWFLV